MELDNLNSKRMKTMKRKKWAVFISGTGSNLAAILDCRSDIDVVLVVSSTRKAYGCLRARREGVPCYVMKNKEDWTSVQERLVESGVELIFLAGFMRIVPAPFLKKWEGRMANVHPSLLPEFPGTHSIERAFERGSPLGVTIHEVIAEVDQGPTILQRRSPSLKSESDSEFLVHLNEHRMVREVVLKWNAAQT